MLDFIVMQMSRVNREKGYSNLLSENRPKNKTRCLTFRHAFTNNELQAHINLPADFKKIHYKKNRNSIRNSNLN